MPEPICLMVRQLSFECGAITIGIMLLPQGNSNLLPAAPGVCVCVLCTFYTHPHSSFSVVATPIPSASLGATEPTTRCLRVRACASFSFRLKPSALWRTLRGTAPHIQCYYQQKVGALIHVVLFPSLCCYHVFVNKAYWLPPSLPRPCRVRNPTPPALHGCALGVRVLCVQLQTNVWLSGACACHAL